MGQTSCDDAIDAIERWYRGLRRYKDNFPAKGSISGALVVLERLKHSYDLNMQAHLTKGGGQIKRASGQAVQNILRDHGETRPFLSEGGRTNRGLPEAIQALLESLAPLRLDALSLEDRRSILHRMQDFLVDRVREFHSRQRLKIVYDPTRSTWQMIHGILETARQTGKEGPVAQYLVGAKLELRFPGEKIDNQSFSTADIQTGRPGDFVVRDTAFHVTVAPMAPVYEKCKSNIQAGLKVYLLVPDRCLAGARQVLEMMVPGQVAVESIESFVSQNIEELSTFSKDEAARELRKLLETYNKRVDAIETDKSMLIEIPCNLHL